MDTPLPTDITKEFLVLLETLGIEGSRKTSMLALPLEQQLGMIHAQKSSAKSKTETPQEILDKIRNAKKPFSTSYNITDIDLCADVLNNLRFTCVSLTEQEAQTVADLGIVEEVWSLITMLVPSEWRTESRTYISLHESKQNKPIFKILEPSVKLFKVLVKSPAILRYIKKSEELFARIFAVFPSQYTAISELVLDLGVRSLSSTLPLVLKHFFDRKEVSEVHVKCVPLCSVRLPYIMEEIYYNLSLGNTSVEFLGLLVDILIGFHNESGLVGIMVDSMLRFCDITRLLAKIKQKESGVAKKVDMLIQKQEEARELATKIDVRTLQEEEVLAETKHDLSAIITVLSVLHKINSSRIYDVLHYIRGTVLEEVSFKNKDISNIAQEREARIQKIQAMQTKCTCNQGFRQSPLPNAALLVAQKEPPKSTESLTPQQSTPKQSSSPSIPMTSSPKSCSSPALVSTTTSPLIQTIPEAQPAISLPPKSIKVPPPPPTSLKAPPPPPLTPKTSIPPPPPTSLKTPPPPPTLKTPPPPPTLKTPPPPTSLKTPPPPPTLKTPPPPNSLKTPPPPTSLKTPPKSTPPPPPGRNKLGPSASTPNVAAPPSVAVPGKPGPRALYLEEAGKLRPHNPQQLSFDVFNRKPQVEGLWSKLDKRSLSVFKKEDFHIFARDKTKSTTITDTPQQSTETSLFSPKKCKAIDIVLARVRVPLKELIAGIDKLDSSMFSEILVAGLLANYPSDEEFELIKKYETKLVPETFYKLSLKIKHFKDKLIVLHLIATAHNISSIIIPGLNKLRQACDLIYYDTQAHRVLHLTLDVINVLNASSRSEGAWGVKVDTLPRIIENKKVLSLIRKKAKDLKIDLEQSVPVLEEVLAISSDMLESETLEFQKKQDHIEAAQLSQLQMAQLAPVLTQLDLLDKAYARTNDAITRLRTFLNEKDARGCSFLYILSKYIISVARQDITSK
ncbi:hypothetical protein NEHOM01_1566 [Nematocida homosporus]|uniref:uncharacterized protein n=1 Tax=Nematocida homosporus TaxID=1912981 RepID=UPI00221F1373|nr:uncharacterized protein NEHOM01_1566 [Nematocida homosporus]KAI5186580.1 hypothetical protein NEHOM01_1566 [Nematocida homosporus]